MGGKSVSETSKTYKNFASSKDIEEFQSSLDGNTRDGAEQKRVAGYLGGMFQDQDGNWSARGGGDMNRTVALFNAWKEKRDQVNAQHAEMVKAAQAAPGRGGTILADAESVTNPEAEASALSPEQLKKKKTLLSEPPKGTLV
jgi:hypothetical protein